MTALELRPRLLWRLGCPAVAALMIVMAATDGDWRLWIGATLITGAAVHAWRNYIQIADGVLLRRGVTGWNDPLVLDALAWVWFYRGGRFFTPYLHFGDRNGASEMLSLRWWTHANELLDVVGAAASRSGAELDSGARRKLGPRRVA